MVWHLQPLHSPAEPSIALPREGSVTVGRRPGNSILCKDLAVSGQHCIFHCQGSATSSLAEPPEVEDCSTNGSYVNEEKITKGERHRLVIDDIVSLTKLADELADNALSLTDQPPRVQFRLEWRDRHEDELAAKQLPDTTAWRPAQGKLDVPATAPDPKPAGGLIGGGGVENCFAQDLLVQEQQSKAKITTQLLQSQGNLEKVRQDADAASRELEMVRKQVAEERARRHEAEENRDRLATEADILRKEQGRLEELQSTHLDLEKRHENVKQDLIARQEKCDQLVLRQEELNKNLEMAKESYAKVSQQHAEVQTRVRQGQERSDRLEQEHAGAKREADFVQEESRRLEKELAAERKAREELDEQVATTREQLDKAETRERTAREALDEAAAKKAGLECQASSAHQDLESARAAARQASQRLAASKQLVERLHEAGQTLSVELKRRAEIWEKALVDGNFDGLEDALASGGPTFAQVTCQVESPPTKSQHEAGGDDAEPNELDKQMSSNQALEPGDHQAAVDERRHILQSAPTAALLPAASTSVLASAGAMASAVEFGDGGRVIEEVAIEDDDDELLAAAAQAPVGETAVVGAAGGASALPGCSTAWSLEVLDAAPGGDLSHPAKRARLNGD